MLKKFLTLESGLKKLVQIIASHISYSNTTSGLSADNLQEAIDELASTSTSTSLCVDGGFANSVFTTEQCIDGGGA